VTRDSVCAIVVTYFPDAALQERLATLLPQVAEIVVVDNGSPDDALQTALGPLASAVHLIKNGQNLGIAAALNTGLAWAAARGHGFVLTLDQDSRLLPHTVEVLRTVLQRHAGPKPAGLAASAYFPYVALASGQSAATEVTATITSGNLVPLEVIAQVGPFDEALFIDWVDIEFCLRLRAAGFVVLETKERLMHHSIGAATPVSLGGLRLTASNHSPFRRYFQFRNAILVTRRYFWREPHYLTRALFGMLKTLVIVALLEQGRRPKLSSAARGIWDGLRGRGGPGRLDAA
jgi:rhamnosyltransferase